MEWDCCWSWFGLLVLVNRWWAPSKFDPVKSPMLFFEKGEPIIPPIPPHVGLDMVLKHMVWDWNFLFIWLSVIVNIYASLTSGPTVLPTLFAQASTYVTIAVIKHILLFLVFVAISDVKVLLVTKFYGCNFWS